MNDTEESRHSRINWLLLAGGVLVALAAYPLVWVPHDRQTRLIEEIEGMGLAQVDLEPVGPAWLRKFGFGRMWGFKAIYHVSLEKVSVDDAWLKKLGRLSNLRKLNLQETRVTDAGVKKLERTLPGCRIRR